MNEEEQVVVNQKEANLEPDQIQEEQVQEQVESEISTTDGKDYKAIAEQLSKDIREKNRKIQELKTQVQPVQQAVEQPVVGEEDTVKRFLATEANATIAVKLQTDPSFKDRVEIVQSYVAQGYDIHMADKLAKADIMDRILAETSTPTQTIIPKQIQPTATPERIVPKPTGNSLDDIQTGKVAVEMDDAQALQEVLNKYRPNRG